MVYNVKKQGNYYKALLRNLEKQSGLKPKKVIKKAKSKKWIKKGDLFQTSWGYDQTNYDFVVVDKVSPSGKTAVCRRAAYDHVGFSGQCNIQKPKAKGYGKSFRLQVRKPGGKHCYGSDVALAGSYIFCGDEDSTSKRKDYFSKVKKGEKFFETDSQFGH